MRTIASARCAGLANVTIDDTDLSQLKSESADLITMVAVLHHLDLGSALREVRNALRPGGRFLCVGLAAPVSAIDLAWNLASTVTNPLIGFVRHPWPASGPQEPPPFPVATPKLSLDVIRSELQHALPGAVTRRHLGFRYSIEWTRREVNQKA